MKKEWKIKDTVKKERIFKDLEPVIEKILLNRNISTEEGKNFFLYPDYEKNLTDPFSISGMKEAVKRVKEALENNEKVCVYGDYDADGVTSSCLLKDFFDQIGLENFCYIPDRNKEGYGINMKAFEYIEKKKTDLIITVDCGISNAKEVEKIKEKSDIDIIILDHHHLPPQIPKALAVVNPKIDKDKRIEFLAGVGVTFKFVQAVASIVDGYDKEKLKWLLDLVAIGTVADCVPLLEENRILTKYGLIVLSKIRRAGLRQIFEVGRINIDENNIPSSTNISFQIAPRINAAGRMDHANIAYELLNFSAKKEAEARVLALELESQNQHRQKITNLIVKEVEERIKNNKSTEDKIIIEKSPNWELGVVGLAAGKISEKYHLPVILLNQREKESKGSGRSIEEFDLITALEEQKNNLKKYGGHRQAAGLTVDNEDFELFKNNLKKKAQKEIPKDLVKSLQIDVKIETADINDQLISQLNFLEPFGQGNPQPVFLCEDLEVVDKKLVGKEGKHLKLWLKKKNGDEGFLEAIGFGMGEKYGKIRLDKKISAVFNLEEDSWNGHKKIQLRLIDFDYESEGQ